MSLTDYIDCRNTKYHIMLRISTADAHAINAAMVTIMDFNKITSFLIDSELGNILITRFLMYGTLTALLEHCMIVISLLPASLQPLFVISCVYVFTGIRNQEFQLRKEPAGDKLNHTAKETL